MHPLRVLLFASLGIAAAIAGGFAYLLARAGASSVESSVLAAVVFGAFMIPWASVFLWAVRRAADLEVLTDRTAGVVAGDERPVHDREFHGELDDLARAVDELRVAMAREKTWSAEQRATMQQIAASLGEGLLAMSPRGRIVLANERVREIFELDDRVVGKPLIEALRNHSILAAFENAMRGNASTDRITLGERQIDVRVFPVATSTEVAAAALFIDITTIERLQRVRREFLDDFSHEVRTPLAGLRSAVETIENGGLTAEQDGHLRAIMTRQLGRIERLVNDLSELNRIESGELVLDRRSVDMRALVRDVVEEFRSRTEGSPPDVTVDGESVWVEVDPPRTQQVFTNLLDNAWKHAGRSGSIEVTIKSGEGMAIVSVSDQGEGIPAHELERIFNRFYRVDKSRSQAVPGSGLGLAITKHLVLLHGGTIRAYNRTEGGATFEVRLPATPERMVGVT